MRHIFFLGVLFQKIENMAGGKWIAEYKLLIVKFI